VTQFVEFRHSSAITRHKVTRFFLARLPSLRNPSRLNIRSAIPRSARWTLIRFSAVGKQMLLHALKRNSPLRFANPESCFDVSQ
jgi:hypothetical protein